MTESLTEADPSMEAPDTTTEWQLRPYRDEDLGPTTATVNADVAANGIKILFTEEERHQAVTRPDFDPATQMIVAEGPRLEGLPAEAVPGWGEISIHDDKDADQRLYSLFISVHPAMYDTGLDRAILARLVEMARSREATAEPRQNVYLDAGVSDLQLYQKKLYLDAGLKQTRIFWTMECPLDNLEEPQHIDGVRVRTYRMPEDNERAVKAFNDSFSDHYDFHPSTLERWNHRMTSPSTRPDLSQLAEVEENPDEMAGFCIVGVYPQENEAFGRNEGWVDLLGTTKAWRRRGLGRAILLHGLHVIKSEGFDTGVLGVDSLSLTGAQRLYESVGFRVRERWLQYKCELSEVQA